MENIFYELIEEASQGTVYIDGELWPIGFNTIIDEQENKYYNEKNLTTLIVKNKENFLKVLNEYIMIELEVNRKCTPFFKEEEKNHIKMLIAYLFVNATTEDFLDPEKLIKRNIAFLKDQTFVNLNDSVNFFLNGYLLDSELEIKNVKQHVAMETPYRLDMSLTKYENGNKLIYSLASISYGIQNDVGGGVNCYIYSLMKPKTKRELNEEEEKYKKKIDRFLYKLNAGINDQESKEFFEYKEKKCDYYPENISDISPSFLLSLIIFLTLLQQKEIHHIKVNPYLPLRYLSRDIAADNVDNLDKKEILKQRNDRIQENITNKFIRLFRRAAYHMEDLKIISFPYEADEFLNLYLNTKKEVINNPILNDISNLIIETEDRIKK